MSTKSIASIGLCFILSSGMALLAVAPGARAEGLLSEDDRFALYCMGALQSATRTILRLYPAACPTGRERGCTAMRESIAAIEEGHDRTLDYLSGRVGARRGIAGQLLHWGGGAEALPAVAARKLRFPVGRT